MLSKPLPLKLPARSYLQLRPVSIPDVVPADAVVPGLLSMCAGDFVVS